MRHNTLALAGLAVAAAVFGAPPANAQESFPHGFIRNVEPGVTLHRATEVTAEEALANLPFLPGDRVWTDAAGRAEFQFPEGTVVRLDSRSKLDYSAHDESRDERVVLRLWSGSLILRSRSSESAVFEIETPGGLVAVAEPGVIRIDVEGGETQLSVYEGGASLDTGRELVQLAGGERTWVRWGDAPAEPEPFDRYAMDNFAEWDIDLESRQAWAANSRRYLPEELAPYAPEFDNHGTWTYEEPVGYVWQPRVAVGWTPYSNGRWAWTSYGWTWVAYEPWGWAPFHYGRWGFSVSLGWHWRPGSVWGPAWVSWGVGGGYVGWCPLGWGNRPVVPWHHRRGHAVPRGHAGYRGRAVPRGSIGHDGAWNVVRRGDLGRGDLARRRVDPRGAAGLRVAESVHERPDRTAGALSRTATATVPAAAAARRRPGTSSRASGAGGGASTGPGRSAAGRATGTPARVGVGWATSSLTGAAARARSRTAPITPTPSSRSGLGTAARARPRNEGTTSGSPGGSAGRVSTSPRTSPSRSNTLGRSRTTAPRTSPAARPQNTAPRSGTTSRPRSSPSSSSTFGRSRTTTPRTSTPEASRGRVTTSPRSSPSRSGAFGRSRTTTSPRTSPSPRSQGWAPRTGVTSRPRTTSPRTTAPRSSVSSRPRSSTPRSRVASPSRSSAPPRSTSSSTRSRTPSSRTSSRPRSGGGASRGSVSRSSPSRSAPSRSGSGSRSSSGSRGSSRSRSGPPRK